MAAAKYWNCRRCAHRNERAWVKCRGTVESLIGVRRMDIPCTGRRPKRPVRAHQKVLRDNSYAAYVQVAADIHGVTDESCCACGKPRSQDRHHDRDHDHQLARMRGLLCPGDTGCNKLLLPWISAPVARSIAEAKWRARESDAARWELLAAYLERAEAHYSQVAE